MLRQHHHVYDQHVNLSFWHQDLLAPESQLLVEIAQVERTTGSRHRFRLRFKQPGFDSSCPVCFAHPFVRRSKRISSGTTALLLRQKGRQSGQRFHALWIKAMNSTDCWPIFAPQSFDPFLRHLWRLTGHPRSGLLPLAVVARRLFDPTSCDLVKFLWFRFTCFVMKS